MEITFVGHAMQNFTRFNEELSELGDFKRALEEQGGPIIVNYRFRREFTKGVEDQWMVNVVNHVLPTEA